MSFGGGAKAGGVGGGMKLGGGVKRKLPAVGKPSSGSSLFAQQDDDE